MSTELSAKVQLALWWISSIAVSVFCCSVLFVLFASYFVDVKSALRDSESRIVLMQERQDMILSEVEAIRKRMVAQSAPDAATPTTEAPASVSISGANPNKGSEATPGEAPVTKAPAAVPAVNGKASAPVAAPASSETPSAPASAVTVTPPASAPAAVPAPNNDKK